MFTAWWSAFREEYLSRWGTGGELPDADSADTTHWYDLPFWF